MSSVISRFYVVTFCLYFTFSTEFRISFCLKDVDDFDSDDDESDSADNDFAFGDDITFNVGEVDVGVSLSDTFLSSTFAFIPELFN